MAMQTVQLQESALYGKMPRYELMFFFSVLHPADSHIKKVSAAIISYGYIITICIS